VYDGDCAPCWSWDASVLVRLSDQQTNFEAKPRSTELTTRDKPDSACQSRPRKARDIFENIHVPESPLYFHCSRRASLGVLRCRVVAGVRRKGKMAYKGILFAVESGPDLDHSVVLADGDLRA